MSKEYGEVPQSEVIEVPFLIEVIEVPVLVAINSRLAAVKGTDFEKYRKNKTLVNLINENCFRSYIGLLAST